MEGDEVMFSVNPAFAALEQGHTIRVSQLPSGKWLCKCLTCAYEQESDDERSAWRDKGWHFGRLSTVHEPYGTFKFEELQHGKT